MKIRSHANQMILVPTGAQSYKWILYGDDDTLFAVENVLRVLEGLDHNMPYLLTDSLWWPEGARGAHHCCHHDIMHQSLADHAQSRLLMKADARSMCIRALAMLQRLQAHGMPAESWVEGTCSPSLQSCTCMQHRLLYHCMHISTSRAATSLLTYSDCRRRRWAHPLGVNSLDVLG